MNAALIVACAVNAVRNQQTNTDSYGGSSSHPYTNDFTHVYVKVVKRLKFDRAQIIRDNRLTIVDGWTTACCKSYLLTMEEFKSKDFEKIINKYVDEDDFWTYYYERAVDRRKKELDGNFQKPIVSIDILKHEIEFV